MRKLLLTFLILPVFIKAQNIIAGDTISSGIIYKNIKDTLLPFVAKATTLCDIDIDGDNIMDIRFSHEHNSSPGFALINKKVFALTNLEFVLTSTNAYADTIARDSTIDAFMNWKYITAGPNLFYFYSSGSGTSQAGQFVKANNYLGFRKISSTDTIYGWFLLDMTNTIKIKSFAYENRGVGIHETKSKEPIITIYPNPVLNSISLMTNQRFAKGEEIEIVNYCGQTVCKSPVTNSIDVSMLSPGIYTLRIVTKRDHSYYSKFVKE